MSRAPLPLLVLAALAVSPLARASEGVCDFKEWHLGVIQSPIPGSTDVPLDTLIWTTDHNGGDFLGVLHGSNGDEIALVDPLIFPVLPPARPELQAWRPERLLTPNTDYVVQRCYAPDDCCDGCAPVTEFRTGTATAAAPELPELLEQRQRQESGPPFARLTVDFTGILFVADASDEFAGTEREGDVIAWHDRPDEPVHLYASGCRNGKGGERWPYEDDAAALRFGAWNLAGEFSGWSEPTVVTIGTPCNCDASAVRVPGWFLLLPLLRRRRRR